MALAWILLLVPDMVVAGEMQRKVGSGESLSLICQKVYGDKELYSLVALYNGIDDPTRISSGENLHLPYSDMVILQSGESLSGLAQRVWGEPKMYPVLAWANGVKDAAVVPAGTRLAVPVLIPYTLKKGQSVSMIAGDIYGNPKVYEVILNASRIEDPTRVPAGTLLKIPYVIPKPVIKKVPVKTTRKPVPKPSPKAAAKKPQSQPEPDLKVEKAMVHLRQAENAFREGRFGDAWTIGHEASGDLTGSDRARALRLMAACQYAFGKTPEALDDLRRAHELDPGFVPDPAYVNPEMIELYKIARVPDATAR